MRGVFLSEAEVADLVDLIEYQHRSPRLSDQLVDWIDYLRGRSYDPSPYLKRKQAEEDNA